jgi:hypothetical protein
MAARRLRLRGEGALVIDAGLETEVVARLGGVLHARNVDLAGDLIVRDEMHCHDAVRHVRHVSYQSVSSPRPSPADPAGPSVGTVAVTTSDVGTLFVVPRVCLMQLPDAPPQGVPLLYEVVGSDVDSLSIRGRLAPTSVVAVDGAMRFLAGQGADLATWTFTNVRGMHLHVRSCITPRDDSEGASVYAFRVTGALWSR